MIDSHCHLTASAFDPDRDAMIARARAAGLRTFITIGAGEGLEGNARAVALAAQHDDIFATVGLHTHDANQFDTTAIAQLEMLAQQPKVVGIGEIGLDYHYHHATKEHQHAALLVQLELAQRCGLPFIIHNREADDDLLSVLRRMSPPLTGVIHCFTGGPAQAQQWLDLGLYLSIPGVVTFKNAEALRAALAVIQRDRLLVETDAPYLAPVPHRGKRNEPAYLTMTIAHIAATLKLEPSEVADITTQNAKRLFQLP